MSVITSSMSSLVSELLKTGELFGRNGKILSLGPAVYTLHFPDLYTVRLRPCRTDFTQQIL